tara:strand:+ start:8208 stop:10982 length:2775 start_codon:yes stop_codon:yes gene_type:complete
MTCDPKTRDRLSIHIENGEHNTEREAITILRNGGTVHQSGLVGITNGTYDPTTACHRGPKLPETIFNVQSTGDSNIRFSSGPSKFYRSSIELLGNGNNRASGLHITYDPKLDDALIVQDDGYGYGYDPCINPQSVDNTVVDFSLIRASGCEGMEFSHISMSERGYVAVGLTRSHKDRHVHPNAPLTIAYACDGHQDSGTISMHEQAASPVNTNNFGKIYVKPYTVGGRSQAIFFKDDTGNETNLVLSQDLEDTNSFDGLIYGNLHGNTFGGHGTPATRYSNSSHNKNTFYGYFAGHELVRNPSVGGTASCNTLIGYRAGSGLVPTSNKNTVLGCNSLTGFVNATSAIVIGDNNLTEGGGSNGPVDAIVIGSDLYNGSAPEDNSLSIGKGSKPLLVGIYEGATKSFSVQDADFEVFDSEEYSYKISHPYTSITEKYTSKHSIIDFRRSSADLPKNNLEFSFENSDLSKKVSLFALDPNGSSMSNNPSYASPTTSRPFARLDGDLKLRGAIRFSDGTSLDGLSSFDLVPTAGTTGIRKTFVTSENTNFFLLDYSKVPLAGNLSTNILTTNTFVAVQVDGTSSTEVGKLSLQGLADYIGGGGGDSVVGENCNILISSKENEPNVNLSKNANSVMIGCAAAYGATGQYNSIIIGNNAGANATISNPSLTTDWSNIFIGSSAGFDSQDVAFTIAIGHGAGKNADSTQDGIFLGNSAGLNSTYTKSVGIGKHALEGSASDVEGGEGNLEIVAGLLNSQRLFHPTTVASAGLTKNISHRLNINNTIAGRSDRRNISIGDAILSPESPLEVRRASDTHASNANGYIQAWYCDDSLVASLDCDGNFVSHGGGGGGGLTKSFIEGVIQSDDNGLGGAATLTVPTSGKLLMYEDGTNTGTDIYIKNRDANLTIAAGKFVVAAKVGTEYRPVWVSC